MVTWADGFCFEAVRLEETTVLRDRVFNGRAYAVSLVLTKKMFRSFRKGRGKLFARRPRHPPGWSWLSALRAGHVGDRRGAG